MLLVSFFLGTWLKGFCLCLWLRSSDSGDLLFLSLPAFQSIQPRQPGGSRLTWSSSKAVGLRSRFVEFSMFCSCNHVAIFTHPQSPSPRLLIQLQRCCMIVDMMYWVLAFLSEAGREKREMSGRAAAREWMTCALSCKLPWNVLKQPWNAALSSIISFHQGWQPESKAPLILCCVKGIFFFFGASVKLCLPEKMRGDREVGLAFRTALARQPHGDANLCVCH